MSSSLALDSFATLKTGAKFPRLGFGVYQSTAATASCQEALRLGYRHIDSARGYRNEEEVLATVREFKEKNGNPDIFLTTKIATPEQRKGPERAKECIEESIAKAEKEGLKWDLFLLHDPCAGAEKRLAAWNVLLEAKKAGKIRHAGVSNFSEKHLQAWKDAGVEMPEVNQIELHVFNQQRPIVEFCEREGIVVSAYCPIARGQYHEDATLLEVSKKVGKTPAQVLIRWCLQKGFVPLPKSDTPSRILENASVFDFELSSEDMAKLDSLDKGKAGEVSWNPIHVD